MHLPVGYHRFHRNGFINYQLNRWYSLGHVSLDELNLIGKRINTFHDYTREFISASEVAKNENRLKEAAVYLRAAEFLLPPDHTRKMQIYRDYLALFDSAMAQEPYERHQVPYGKSFLSAIKFPAQTEANKGTIIGIPGFDACIEEFYGIWQNLARQGYDVVAFEGPGQGATLRQHGLLFDHDYEKPTSAVIDYFALEEVTALGLSMGGYWIMRAAAFEERIKRVVAMPPVFDWLERTNGVNRWIAKWLLKHRKIANFLIQLKLKSPIIRHTVSHALFIQEKKEPYDAITWLLGMNKEHISSELITQDVLLLGGANDSFQPPVLLKKQQSALSQAKSVTSRIFTKAEMGHQHCQIGNLQLAIDTIIAWIENKGTKE